MALQPAGRCNFRPTRSNGSAWELGVGGWELTIKQSMEPVLTKYVREPNSYTLDFFLKHQGYEGLRKALAMQPNAVIETVKASGLRGRGGAGVPTGLKWQFVLQGTPLPKYIPCN